MRKSAPPEETKIDIGVVEAAIQEASEDGAEWLTPGRFRPWRRKSPWRDRSLELRHECMQAAKMILSNAQAARDVGAKIRWFDFEAFQDSKLPAGGIPQLLEPVNAVEITGTFTRKRLRAFDYLRLSLANRESPRLP